MLSPFHVPWRPDVPDFARPRGEDLAEFAGRACYQSWSRPNPATATNEGYIRNILKVGHFSVLEHASASFYIEGVSRSLTHELVRHRHLSFSQLSQRYVDGSDAEFVMPPIMRRALKDTAPEGTTDEEIEAFFQGNDFFDDVRQAYEDIVNDLTELYPDAKRKQIREAARLVMPNATETKIVVTGNYRAWRHFIGLRAAEAADAEIRELAVEICRQLQNEAPSVFGDFSFEQLEDGSTVARAEFATS